MKTLLLIFLKTLWFTLTFAGNTLPDTVQVKSDTTKKVTDYVFVDLTSEMKTSTDTQPLADEQLLTETFIKYFAGDEHTINLQVNLSPCQITIIETYRYYGNPHIRLWTFHTDVLTIGPGLNGRIRIDIDRGTVYDSRIKHSSELHEIDLKGVPNNTMGYRDKLERAWYRYKEHCNEPPEAY